jgi:spermidine synthase
MYHVVGTLLTISLLYSLSYFFYINDFYSLQFHRKLWNSLLAAAFILTAFAGLFLAIQSNYKWDVPFIKSILRWHVEFGIGMTATGLLHFSWHFSYFRGLFIKQVRPTGKMAAEPVVSDSDISVNLFIVGFTSTAVQLLMLKEMINISGGYELIAGTFLGSWLIGSAAGALMASGSAMTDLRKMNLFFFSGPVVSVFLMLFLTRLFLRPGETPSFLASVIYTLIVVIPFCFVSGFTFIKLVAKASKTRRLKAGTSFSVETTGGILSGITVSFLSTAGLNTYQAIILIIILGYSYSVITFLRLGTKKILLFKFIVLAISIMVILTSPDRIIRQFLLRGLKVTQSIDTPYGNITRGVYGGEKSTYYDQRLLFYHDDAIEREEDIHYPMLQLKNPESVLLISGSIAPHIREILKYPVKKIVYVERDPALARSEVVADNYSPGKVNVENKDAYSYVKRTNEKFDAVILLLPPPSSLLINRYYTIEFFKNIKKSLRPGGVFSCSPGTNPDYLNNESVNLFSSVFNSLKSIFKNVIPVSGNKLYLIASDNEISTSFCDLTGKKNISTVYVGPDYLADDLVALKSEEVKSVIDKTVKANSILSPTACFYYQVYHLSKDLDERIPTIVLLSALFLLPVLSVRRRNLLMYFSSSALSGLEIIILLIMQSAIGNMYQVTGMILAGLMAGLAVGAGTSIRLFEERTYGFKALVLTGYYLIIYFISGILIRLDGKAAVTILLMLAGFLPAVVTGNLFREFSGDRTNGSDSSRVYGADLAGSAMGCIIFSGLAVPLFGIKISLLIFPVFILAGFLFTFTAKKQ